MIYLAYFIIGFTVVQFLVALVNLLWGRFGYKWSKYGQSSCISAYTSPK